MNAVWIDHAQLLNPGEGRSPGSLLIEQGRIAAVNPDPVPSAARRIDAGGRLLTPGLIDLHTHGLGHGHFSRSGEWAEASRFAAALGVTSLYPTLVPQPGPNLLASLVEASAALDQAACCRFRGLHLEGPFVALPGAACAAIPGDRGLLDEMLAACAGRMAIMSVSPDTPGILPVIERLAERGVVPFITHTRATAGQTQAAIAAGARHATHFYDLFVDPPAVEPGVRPVGALEAILADPRTTVDFIADGCHVAPLAIQAWTRALGWERVLLITDSNVGAGLPPGVYDTPWGYPVRVRPGDGARIAAGANAGALAGSALTLREAVSNAMGWLPDLPPDRVWAMATRNPARLLGLAPLGRLDPGADADLVLWSDAGRPVRTWVGGRLVFDALSD